MGATRLSSSSAEIDCEASALAGGLGSCAIRVRSPGASNAAHTRAVDLRQFLRASKGILNLLLGPLLFVLCPMPQRGALRTQPLSTGVRSQPIAFSTCDSGVDVG